jgi:ribonucleoside-diphosphate reductase subunit M2
VLAFFAASDGIVMENLSERFSKDIPKSEVRAFYAFQNAMEAIHSETYSLLIETYVKDDAVKDQLFNAVRNFPAIREKAEWAIKWIENKQASFAQRLVAFAIVEGLFFSASFCAIFWLRERGMLPGLSFANQLIARDESMHTDFAILLYSKLEHRLPQSVIHEMIRDAVSIETKFITESIPCSMIGMNVNLMTEYIMYIADRLIAQLGYEKVYNKTNPFAFMEKSATQTKSSFFEVRVADYNKANVSFKPGQSAVPTELAVNIGDDF